MTFIDIFLSPLINETFILIYSQELNSLFVESTFLSFVQSFKKSFCDYTTGHGAGWGQTQSTPQNPLLIYKHDLFFIVEFKLDSRIERTMNLAAQGNRASL